MHFVNDLSLYLQSIPVGVMPEELSRIDDHGWSQWPFGLEARRGIRNQVCAAIQAVAIKIAGLGPRAPRGKISVGFGIQFNNVLPPCACLGNHFHCSTIGCPDPKVNLAAGQNFRADGKPPAGYLQGSNVLTVFPALRDADFRVFAAMLPEHSP